MKREKLKKLISRNWLKTYPNNEIEQEELIQLWKNPELIGYEGLLAFNELFYKMLEANKIPTTRLKKNLVGSKLFPPFITLVEELLSFIPKHLRAKCSVLLQPVIHEHLYGKQISSIRSFSKLLGIKKSTLANFILDCRQDLPPMGEFLS